MNKGGITIKSAPALPSSIPKEVQNALKEFSAELLKLYGDRLKALYLYGSYARGTQHSDSDLDVLVVLSGKVNAGREIHAMSEAASRVCLKYGQLLSTVPVSLDGFRQTSTPFLRNILPELIAV